MLNIVYISISGNTRSFVHKIKVQAKQQHTSDTQAPLVSLKRITNQTDLIRFKQPFFCFVPTYVEGGNSMMDVKMQAEKPKEIETLTMDDELNYADNYKNCLGLIGSGNRNFNYLFAYTAKLYSSKYHIPVIDTYELRGMPSEAKRIYNEMVKSERHSQISHRRFGKYYQI